MIRLVYIERFNYMNNHEGSVTEYFRVRGKDKIRFLLHYQNMKLNSGAQSGLKCQSYHNNMERGARVHFDALIWKIQLYVEFGLCLR